jgi:hypothetical protein
MTRDINRTVGWLFLLGFVWLTGCKSADQANTGHMASVEIYGHTSTEIQKATAAAFSNNGYYQIGELTFEKIGSSWETANYGGWSSDSVWIKVRAEIVTEDSATYTLSCDAYAIEAHGEGIMQIERKFKFAKRKECKKILDEVKRALETSSATGAGNP